MNYIEHNEKLSILEAALRRERGKKNTKNIIWTTIGVLLIIAAVAVLFSFLLMPTMRVSGASMTPTLYAGDWVLGWKNTRFQRGDIVALTYNNNILVKRIIATEGEWIWIDPEGSVYIAPTEKELTNSVLLNSDTYLLDEPYVQEKSFGKDSDMDFSKPIQVPADSYFVMGDHRSVSVDSRSRKVGFVKTELIVGRMAFRIWPIDAIGSIDAN